VAKSNVVTQKVDERVKVFCFRLKTFRKEISNAIHCGLTRAEESGDHVESIEKVRKGYRVDVHLGDFIHSIRVKTSLDEKSCLKLLNAEWQRS
jgi:hypothetical protein